MGSFRRFVSISPPAPGRGSRRHSAPVLGPPEGKTKTTKGEKYWSHLPPTTTPGVSPPKVIYTYPRAGLLERDEEEEEEERGEISSRAGRVEGEEEVGQAGGSQWHLGGKLRQGRKGERDGVSWGGAQTGFEGRVTTPKARLFNRCGIPRVSRWLPW